MNLRLFLPLVFAVLVLGVASSLPEAEAHEEGPFEDCIEDENSEVCLTDTEDNITNSWTIFNDEEDSVGIDHLDGQELYICELVDVNESDGVECADEPTSLSDFTTFFSSEGNSFDVDFQDEDFPDLTISVTWQLIGGLFGSSESTLKETIRLSEGTSTYRFFQETDFNLAGGSPDTFVSISPTFARQEDSTPESGLPMKGTVSVSPPADGIMVAVFDEVVEAITEGGELDGTTGPLTGERDYVFGFSWDVDLTERESFTIEKTKQLGVGELTFLASPGGNGGHESPTIGKNSAGIQIVNSKGICIDPLKNPEQCWTVTEFDTGFKLLPLLSSSHTITNTIFCNEGVQECDYVGVSFMTSTDLFGELVMMVEAQKTDGEWIISWYDPQDFIHDPGDYLVGDPRGAITFTAQIVDDTGILSQNGNFLLTSFTIDFKNKDTGELVIRIQVGDEERGQSTFWFNEGVEIIDSDAYPSIETAYENSLEINSLCLNEDPTYRYSCGFAEILERTIQNAEETLRQMLNGEYIYK